LTEGEPEQNKTLIDTISTKQAAREVIKAYDAYDQLVLLCLGAFVLSIIVQFIFKYGALIICVAVGMLVFKMRMSLQDDKKRLNQKYELDKIQGLV
jgi:uncharacterized membrane protein YciS (DUF1049 family)